MTLKCSNPGAIHFFRKNSLLTETTRRVGWQNDRHIVNFYLCICRGSRVKCGKFIAGFTATYAIKKWRQKVEISAVNGKLQSCHGNPTFWFEWYYDIKLQRHYECAKVSLVSEQYWNCAKQYLFGNYIGEYFLSGNK